VGAALPALLLLTAVAQPTLEVPWTCGASYMCTQDHNGGSHTGYGAWAWDFGLSEGTEVWAAAEGTVDAVRMDSNTGGCDAAYANDANYVAVDHGDGTAALYLHLQQWSSSLGVGDWVYTGEPVGRIGLTGWVCGAHLHFQVQSVCGSWWCQSMQAQFYDYGDPSYGDWLTSDNCGGGPACAAVLDGGETTIDETDSSCFHRVSQWWWDVEEGYDGHHYFTYATDEPDEETVGEWHFDVASAGHYEVRVHVPQTEADSQHATYQIHHADGVSSATLNQAEDKGWQSLGIYRFEGGEDERLHLGDNTGEDYETLGRKLAYDAARFAWSPPGDDDTGDDDTGDDDTGDDDTGTPGDDDAGDDDTGSADDDDSGGPPPGDDDDTGGQKDKEEHTLGGCSCAGDQPHALAAAPALGLATSAGLLPVAALRRRRR